MVRAAPVDDHGARALYPFCIWPQPAAPRGKRKAAIEIAFARNGDPNDIAEMVPTSPGAASGHRARVVDPLSWYASRKPKFLPRIFVQAGRQFQDDFEWLTCHCGPQASDPGRPVVSTNSVPGPPLMIDQIAVRRSALEQALDFVGGPELDRLLVDVVGRSRPMAAYEKAHDYPTGSGQVALRIALYRLAMSYGMISTAWRP